jgi:hypothetical protein
MDAERDKGDCYEASLKTAEFLQELKVYCEAGATDQAEHYDLLTLSNPIHVVHGTAVAPTGPYVGEQFLHAWVEIGDFAIETSNGQQRRFLRAEFYVDYGISPVIRYSPEQARALAIKHGKYYAWHTLA